MVRLVHENWLRGAGPEECRRLIENADSIFGKNMRAARRTRGWSQRQLSDEIEAIAGNVSLDPSAITRIEGGGRAISLKQALAVAAALDVVAIEELIEPATQAWPEDLEAVAADLERAIDGFQAERAQAEAAMNIKSTQIAGYTAQLNGIRALIAEQEGKPLSLDANGGVWALQAVGRGGLYVCPKGHRHVLDFKTAADRPEDVPCVDCNDTERAVLKLVAPPNGGRG